MTETRSFLRRHLPWALSAWILLTAAVVGVVVWLDARRQPMPAAENEASKHEASGVIRSFGSGRSYVNIAHDPIEGFMAAMTMAFEFQSSEQSSGLDVGDRVTFSFSADRQGRLVIDSIAKAP
ncbi:copper-binding protein [Pendulispora rubella]|uniref:Copper-binding protein n=1 Tax=Pendulispora rubella TaxID=2741070 RepID=A0ABZ2LBF5_9BACT